MQIKSVNPFSNKVNTVYESHTSAQLEEKLQLAEKVWNQWARTGWEERSVKMKKVAQSLRDRKDELALLITREMGKVISESRSEIDKCAWVCDYYAERASEFLKDEPLPVEDGKAYIAYDPIGPVLAIMPWNFPFWQVFRFAAPNIMAGNTGLLKHASNVPGCALAIESLFNDAEFPQGVFQTLLIGSSEAGKVIADPRVKGVTLTGSDTAGAKVAEQAGNQLKKTVLELGGSDPFIVLDDANLEEAAKIAAKARMINCGQSCIAAKRFIVTRKISESFKKLFKQNLEALAFGNPEHDNTGYASMASRKLAEQLEDQVQESLRQGAKLLLGSGKVEPDGAVFHPTIITDIPPESPAYREELFGPVAILFTVENAEEAVKLANDSPFGLGAAVWTQNKTKGAEIAREIQSGMVIINGMVASHPKVPFGGVKRSGYGRELSYPGIREFMNLKSIWIK